MKKEILILLIILPLQLIAKTSNSIELYDLINLFAPNKSFNYGLYDWSTEANNKNINWATDGIKMSNSDFYRNGEVVISINKKTLNCLGKNPEPCKWYLSLTGPRGGYTSFEISSVNSQEMDVMSINELFKGRIFKYNLLAQDDDGKIYRVTFPNKKPIKMNIVWSCGSGGCSLIIRCDTNI